VEKRLPLFLAAPALGAGRLRPLLPRRLLPRWLLPPIPLAPVYARSAFRPLRARLLLEHLLEALARDPPPWAAGRG